MNAAKLIWIDATAGATGDMLAGALLEAGGGKAVTAAHQALATFAGVTGEHVDVSLEPVTRAGLAASRVSIDVSMSLAEDEHLWPELEQILNAAAAGGLKPSIAEGVRRVFDTLVSVESQVHGVPSTEVHFHDVLDLVAEVVACVAALDSMGWPALACSPVTVGSGTAATHHGILPVPVPAVAQLLAGAPTTHGDLGFEACSPIGAALLAALVEQWGPQPPMTVKAVGVGAGGRDPEDRPNVTRAFLGTPASAPGVLGGDGALVQSMMYRTLRDLSASEWPQVATELTELGVQYASLALVLDRHGLPAHEVRLELGTADPLKVSSVLERFE